MTTANIILAAITAAIWTAVFMTVPDAANDAAKPDRFVPERYCLSELRAPGGARFALPCRDVFDEREA